MTRFARVLLASTLISAPAFANDPTIDRQGSKLRVTWQSDEAGNWELVAGDGNVCASGRYSQGDNQISLDKVAAPTDMQLRLTSIDGADHAPFEFAVPGIKRLSRLTKPTRASIIYQVPVRTYLAKGNGAAQTGKLNDLTAARLAEIRDLGADYLWLTGVLEHVARSQTDPDVVKGDAGSYYAIYDNWDVSDELGTLADFEALVDRAHAAGLRILVDFVANHTARMHRTDVACKQHMDFGRGDRTDREFDRDNNYYYMPGTTFTPPAQAAQGTDGVFDTDIFAQGVQLEQPARVTGNDIVSPNPPVGDWFETVKLNYGWDLRHRRANYDPRPRTWNQMIDVAKYWVEKGVDGFRVDYAHAVPIEFWRTFASELKKVQPEVFLLAEAYEGDLRMRLPGFSYYAMLDAGFDSVYDSEMYWKMHGQVERPGDMASAAPFRSPAFQGNVVDRGFMFTHYMENHDEQRVASRNFAQWLERPDRADLGLAYSAYLGLLPGHFLIHGGQEVQEDASVFGPYAGDNGKTSIFDYIYQSQTRLWVNGTRPQWMVDFRRRYQDLLELKRRPAFSAVHKTSAPSLVDLYGANFAKDQAKWINSYVRYSGNDRYLVVTNGDPFVAHAATIHLTVRDDEDTFGALRALGIENGDRRYVFTEVFSRKNWIPHDPAVPGDGMPGKALHKAGGVPSGLFLGDVPPRTTYVFKVTSP